MALPATAKPPANKPPPKPGAAAPGAKPAAAKAAPAKPSLEYEHAAGDVVTVNGEEYTLVSETPAWLVEDSDGNQMTLAETEIDEGELDDDDDSEEIEYDGGEDDAALPAGGIKGMDPGAKAKLKNAVKKQAFGG